MEFCVDAVAQHILAAQPKAIRDAIIRRGFSDMATNPLVVPMSDARKEFRKVKSTREGDQTGRTIWICRTSDCESKNTDSWDVCSQCAAITVPTKGVIPARLQNSLAMNQDESV